MALLCCLSRGHAAHGLARCMRLWGAGLHAAAVREPQPTLHGDARGPAHGAGRPERAAEGAAARCARLARYTLRRGRVVAALLGRLATLPEAVVRATRRACRPPRSSVLSSMQASIS
jgi:hypothetical protein